MGMEQDLQRNIHNGTVSIGKEHSQWEWDSIYRIGTFTLGMEHSH